MDQAKDFTDISSAYEEPGKPEFPIGTSVLSLEASAGLAIALLQSRYIFPPA